MLTLPHHLSGIALACAETTHLSADDVATITGHRAESVAGLLGPVDVATVTVSPDIDVMRPWDWESAPHEGAIIPFTRGEWIAEPVIGHDAPDWITEALDHYSVDGASHEGDDGVRYLTRYARARGYVVTVETLSGMSPSDWMDVLTIHQAGRDDGVAAWREYWDEGGFYVTVDIDDTGFSESVATTGYAGIEGIVSELLGAGIRSRLQELRAAS